VPARGPAVTNGVAPNPGEIAVANGRAFVAATTDHVVFVLDARTGQVVGEPIPAGRNPYAMTAGAGHVYAVGRGDNSVTRIDP
jgi:DNA-binding beta-propeller fold protein YncE